MIDGINDSVTGGTNDDETDNDGENEGRPSFVSRVLVRIIRIFEDIYDKI